MESFPKAKNAIKTIVFFQTHRFCTSLMNSPTLLTSFAAVGCAFKSTPLGEPS